MRSRRLGLFLFASLSLLLAAPSLGCRSRSEGTTKVEPVVTAVPETIAKPPRDGGGDASLDAAAAEPPRAPRAGKWSTVPDPHAALSYVVDGYCAQIRVTPSKIGPLVWWGEGQGYVARVTDQGLASVDELSKGLPGAHDYRLITANAEGDLFVDANTGGRASMSTALLHRGSKGWDTVIETDMSGDAGFSIYHLLGTFGAGALATVARCGANCQGAGFVAVGEKVTPNLTWDGDAFGVTAWIADDKTVIIGGQRCTGELSQKCTCVAKATMPDGTVKPLALDAEPCGISIAGSGHDAVLGTGAMLARFDGAAWRRIAAPRGDYLRVEAIDKSGAAWVSNRAKLYREKAGAWEDVSPPGGLGDVTHGNRIDGLMFGEAWAVTATGGVVRTSLENVAWSEVPVPLPPFAAIKKPPTVAGVVVTGPGDAWLNVTYGTQFEGTPSVETRRALIRTKAPIETLRCGARSGREGVALEAWPPRGTPACKNLAVIVAQAAPSKDVFPRTRAVLKGHKELGEWLDLVTVKVADPPYVVAPVPTYDVALKLATLIGKKVPFGVVPEIVCTEPEGERTRVDLVTGDVVVDDAAAR